MLRTRVKQNHTTFGLLALYGLVLVCCKNKTILSVKLKHLQD